MNKVALLVIVYGKQLVQSDTINSILAFEHTLDSLVIVNNGPKAISENDVIVDQLKLKHKNIVLKNCLENKPLSWIYNDFINDIE
ncbi:glycosyl transferase, partial [Acinetobacter puyangensis]